MGQKQAAYDNTGAIIAFYDTVDSPAPQGVSTIDITDAQWQAALASVRPYTVVNKAMTAPADPSAAELLAEAQAAKIAELSAACKAAIYAGFSSSALGSAYHYPALDDDQRNLTASVVASLMPGLPSNWTTPFKCADANGNWAFVPHTVAQIQTAGADGKSAILAAMAKNQTLAAQASAATTVAAVNAIAW